MTPAGTSNELDVQNGWEENTHTHTTPGAVCAVHTSSFVWKYVCWLVDTYDHVLWDRNPGFLNSEIGPFSDFEKKYYLIYGVEIGSFEESDFQESGEVDRLFNMGTHYQERPSSLENRLCYGYAHVKVFVATVLLILVAVEQTYGQITRRLVAQKVAPAAQLVLSQTQALGDRGY